MRHERRTYRFLNAMEVEEICMGRYGAPGMRREKREKPTPEQMEKQNQANREKLARRKLRGHFDVNDYFTTLTYERDKRPADMETAKAEFSKFIRAIRKEYRKRGEELRWMRNIELGTKGAWHIHIIINRIPDTDVILAENWKRGKVHNQLMYQKGEFRDLAAYITKTPKTDPRLKESSYSTSRNLPVPEPKRKEYTGWKRWRAIRIPKGWYLEPDSLVEGINPVTGKPYRHYTLLRINRKERGKGRVRSNDRGHGKPKRLPGGAGVRRQKRTSARKAGAEKTSGVKAK